ncbi:MAG: EpsG family protein [Clostridia bacterium]|nr:EpsG family protein [Clostridia bacterium]
MTTIAYLIFYLICALNIVWGIRKRKSNALYAVALVVVFILMTFNYFGPDIEVYRLTYELVGNSSNLKSAFAATYMEKGYTFLMFCASKMGLNFYAFRIILTFVCLILFTSSIKYYKVNPNIIIGLYMSYIFFFDTIQLRNCIIQFIILFATRYLLDKSKLSIIKYIICISIAGSIHVLSWLFLSLLLIKIVKTKIGYQRIFLLAASLFVICLLIQPILPQIIDAIVKFLKRGSGYFDGTISYGFWAVMALHMLGLIPLYWYNNKITNETSKAKINLILKIEIIVGLFLPFCFINNNFNRIFRNILVLDTIGLTLLYENLKKSTEANDVTLAALLLLVGGWLGTDLLRYEAKKIIGSVMEYNLIYTHINLGEIGQYFIVILICLFISFAVKKMLSFHKEQHKKEIKCA